MDCSTPGFPVHHQIWSLLKLIFIKSVMPSNHLIHCKQWQFYFFSMWILFLLLLWLPWLGLPKLCWINVAGVDILVLDLRGNAFTFSPLRMMFAVGLSYMTFIVLKLAPSVPTFWRDFIIKCCSILSKAYSASVEIIMIFILQFVKMVYQFGRSVVSDSLQPHRLQQARLPYPSLTPRDCSHSCALSWWFHSTISSSVVPFSSCL